MGQREYRTVDLATTFEGSCTTDGEVLNPFETAGSLHQSPIGQVKGLGHQRSSPEIPRPNFCWSDYSSDPMQPATESTKRSEASSSVLTLYNQASKGLTARRELGL